MPTPNSWSTRATRHGRKPGLVVARAGAVLGRHPRRARCTAGCGRAATRSVDAPTRCSPASRRAPTPAAWIAGMESGIFSHRAAATTAGSQPTRLARVAHARARHALQRRPLRPPGPLLGRHDADGHGRRRAPSARSTATTRTASSTRRCVDGLIVAQRPGLQPRRPHACTCRDSHPSVQTIWAFDYDTATGTPLEPPRVRRHEPAARPARRRGGRRRRLLLDLRQRRRPGAPLHARGQARPLARGAGEEAGDVRLRRRRSSTRCTSPRSARGGDLSDQPLAGGVFALRPGVQGIARAAVRLPDSDSISRQPPSRGRQHEDSQARTLIAAIAAAPGRASAAQATEFRSADIHPDDYPTVAAVKYMSERAQASSPAARTRSRSSTTARSAPRRTRSSRSRSARWR